VPFPGQILQPGSGSASPPGSRDGFGCWKTFWSERPPGSWTRATLQSNGLLAPQQVSPLPHPSPTRARARPTLPSGAHARRTAPMAVDPYPGAYVRMGKWGYRTGKDVLGPARTSMAIPRDPLPMKESLSLKQTCWTLVLPGPCRFDPGPAGSPPRLLLPARRSVCVRAQCNPCAGAGPSRLGQAGRALFRAEQGAIPADRRRGATPLRPGPARGMFRKTGGSRVLLPAVPARAEARRRRFSFFCAGGEGRRPVFEIPLIGRGGERRSPGSRPAAGDHPAADGDRGPTWPTGRTC
jgi:hypothetical protein